MDNNTSVQTSIPKKGTDVELYIESLAFGGMGIARVNEKVIFVKNAIPGQKVLARITKKRTSYLEARKLDIINESKDFIKPICDHFNDCGGCSFQNLSYEKQLYYKEKQVNDLYRKMGNFKDIHCDKIVPCNNQYSYRNKMEFSFSNKRWILNTNDSGERKDFALGLHVSGRYDKILNISNCDLQQKQCNKILNLIKNECINNQLDPYDIKKHTGYLRHLMIRYGVKTNEIMVNFITSYEKTDLLKPIVKKLLTNFPEINCIVNNINTKKADIAFGEWEINLSGKNIIIDKIGDYEFEISANSFFQTNTQQAEILYNIIKEECNLKGNEIVYDLYSGIGSISIFLSKYAKSIYAIELIETAVNDAKKNAKRNKVNNINFFCGDLKDILRKDDSLSSIPKPDIIIIDPPRAGMHKKTIKDIIKFKPKKIIYCSCNPSTQVRDIIELSNNGYKLKKIRPVDMFPNTPHIECVSTLEYNN